MIAKVKMSHALFYERVDMDNLSLKKMLEIEAEMLRHAELFGTLELCKYQHLLDRVCKLDRTFRDRLDAAYRPLPDTLQKGMGKVKSKLNVYHLLTTPERRVAVEKAFGRKFVRRLENEFCHEHPWYN